MPNQHNRPTMRTSLLALAIPVAGRPLHVQDRQVQKKFTPASAEVDWQRIQHLVMTANTTGQQQGDGNSAAFACLMALALGSIEPPLRMWHETEPNKREAIPDHAIESLLNKPNSFHHSLRELLFWKTWCQHVEGNAYFLKRRSGNANTGNTVELWPVSPLICEPYTARGSSNYIDGYKRWDADLRKWILEPQENIVHFRLGIDDKDHRKGLAPLQRLLREIASDAAATRWTDRMLSIGGAASMMVTVPKDSGLNPDQIEDMRDRIEMRFTGERVGSVGVLAGGATANRYGFSPSEMDLRVLHSVPETRIAAVIGVHPAVAGLGVGLELAVNFASLKEIYIAFTERKLGPLWVSDEDALNHSLLPDFNSDPNVMLGYDMSKVGALQEDVNGLWKRVTDAFDKGLLTVNQALPLLGLDIVDEVQGDLRKLPGAGGAPAVPGAAQPGADQPGAAPAGGDATGDNTSAPPKTARRGLSIKATDLDRWPDLMDALVDLAAPSFADDLAHSFDDTRRRTKRAILRNGVLR